MNRVKLLRPSELDISAFEHSSSRVSFVWCYAALTQYTHLLAFCPSLSLSLALFESSSYIDVDFLRKCVAGDFVDSLVLVFIGRFVFLLSL